MINEFNNSIREYYYELSSLTPDEIRKRETDSISLNGVTLYELPALINEKLKINSSFSDYVIETIPPHETNRLRRLIEDYNERITLYLDNQEYDNLVDLKRLTISIELLFGIDVSFLETLATMYQDDKMEKLYEYINQNEEISLSGIDEVINRNHGRSKF